jgi:hypothetical protein
MMPRIHVLLHRDGTVVMEGEGFTGPACVEAMRPLMDTLGQVTHEEAKPEYYEGQVTQTLEGTA